MITTTMTRKEIARELDKDTKEYQFYAFNLFRQKRYYNEALKHKGEYHFKPVYWKSRRGNNYILLPYSVGKSDTKKWGIINWFCFSYYFDEHNRLNAISRTNDYSYTFYTSHMFDRYAERFLEDEILEKRELMVKFFNRNSLFSVQPFWSSNYKDSYIGRVKDGIVLGKLEDGMYHWNTFITEEMLKGSEIVYNIENRIHLEDALQHRYDIPESLENLVGILNPLLCMAS